MMIYTLLRINILVSDQYGRTETKVIGIFDDADLLEAAKKAAAQKYKGHHHTFILSEIEPNVSYEEA